MFRGVISRDEAGLVPPSGWSGEQFYDEGLIIHWEGPFLGWPWPHEHCFELVRAIQSYHMTHGYSDVAYNDIACPHGFIFACRSGVPMANAASGNSHINGHAPAVCLLWGQGDDADPVAEGDQLTQDARDAVAWRRESYIASAGMSVQTRGHSDIVATACPGPDGLALARSLDGSGAPIPAPPAPDEGPRLLFLADPLLEGDDVAHVQAQLASLGYDLGPWGPAGDGVDGFYGSDTAAAVVAFQTAAGIGVDGIVGSQTRGALDAATGAPVPAPAPPQPAPGPSGPGWPGRYLRQPPVMSGDDVAVWQARMAERGWAIAVDGDYGPQSDDVATSFQREKGLTVDGIVGPQTWDAAWSAPVT